MTRSHDRGSTDRRFNGFADMLSTGPGQRVMDISLEGASWLSGLDVVAVAGAKTAL